MKKTISLLFFCLLLTISCKNKQALVQTKVETTVNKDSVFNSKITIKNEAIIDSLKVVIGNIRTSVTACDSVCQIAIDKVLSNLNTQKKSGNNSYGIYYDKADKSLNLNTKIGETKSDSIVVEKYIKILKTIYSHKDIPVERPIPKWQLFLMIIGAATIGFYFYKITIFVSKKAVS